MTILVDSVSPVTVRVTVQRAAGSDVDFTAVTSAVIHVRKPAPEGYAFVDWTPSLVVVSSSLLRLVYPLQAGDVDRVGDYALAADLIVPGGVVPCEAAQVRVAGRF